MAKWLRRSLVTLGILFSIASVAYVEFCLRRPVGQGPAGPSIASEPFDGIWTDHQVLLLGVGDSITRGLGADRPSHSFFNRLLINPDDEWPEMDGKCLSKCLPNLKSRNLAISGSTSLDHEDILQRELTKQSEEVFGLVVMTSGGNDLIHPYGRRPPSEGAMYGATTEQAKPWVDQFEQRLKRNLQHITEAFPGGCLIFLADIYDPTDGVGDAPSIFLPPWPDGLEIHAEYNRVINKVAGSMQHVHVVPLYDTFLGHGSHCRQFWRAHYHTRDPHYWFYSNIEDPNDRGYDAIRRLFLQAIVDQRNSLGRVSG